MTVAQIIAAEQQRVRDDAFRTVQDVEREKQRYRDAGLVPAGPRGGLPPLVTHADYFPPLTDVHPPELRPPGNDVTDLLGGGGAAVVNVPSPPVVTLTVGAQGFSVPIVESSLPVGNSSVSPYPPLDTSAQTQTSTDPDYGPFKSSVSSIDGGGEGGESGWDWQQKDGPKRKVACRHAKKAKRKKARRKT